MKNQITEFERKLRSNKEWRFSTDIWIIEHFEFLGFKCPQDFMRLRFYDYFNLDCVDNNRAEEMLLALSDFLFPDREEDLDYEEHLEEEKYIHSWLKEHKNIIADTRIEDILCDENISKDGFLELFDCITQCFYKSSEYDSRHYKYGNLNAIPKKQRT